MAGKEKMKVKKSETSIAGIYKEKLMAYEFMHKYLEEPEIFNFGSPKFKEFLVHSIINLRPDFAYLTFLNTDDVDQELVKVLGILQIISKNTSKKNENPFNNWTECDIYKFWAQFFSISEILIEEQYSIENSLNLESKIDFMKDIESIFQYLNYDFPVCHSEKLSKINLSDEISKWNDDINLELKISTEETPIGNCEDEELFTMNIKKLISDLKHIMATYDQLKPSINDTQQNEINLFSNLITLTNDVLKYCKSYDLIELKTLKKALDKYLLVKENKSSSNDLYFLKTYGNFINNLKSKVNLYFS